MTSLRFARLMATTLENKVVQDALTGLAMALRDVALLDLSFAWGHEQANRAGVHVQSGQSAFWAFCMLGGDFHRTAIKVFLYN